MKRITLIINFLFCLCFVYSQNGIIYNFSFRIDNELVTQMKAQNKDFKILNLSTVEEMPKQLSDDILLVSESLLGEYLKDSLISMRPEEKLIMGALPEHLMYLPANRFKKAAKSYNNLKFFIDIYCYITATGGKKIILGNKSFSKVKPKITLKIRVFNKEKELIEKKEAIIKDFETLRSKTYDKTYGIAFLKKNTDEVTFSETINSNDVLRMYLQAIKKALK